YQVSGWSRTPKSIPGIRTFSGSDGLRSLLPETDILVCMLPLTPATRGVLGEDTLVRLPRGSAVINVGRGGCLDERALIHALDSGHLDHATLDVFETEPLSPLSPLWKHP